MSEDISTTDKQALADSICKQLSEVLTAWDKERLSVVDKQNKYLSFNIDAILQGQKDIKKDTKNIEDRMVKIEELAGLHNTAIERLKRYSNIENTAIRILIAVVIAVAVAVLIHKFFW